MCVLMRHEGTRLGGLQNRGWCGQAMRRRERGHGIDYLKNILRILSIQTVQGWLEQGGSPRKQSGVKI